MKRTHLQRAHEVEVRNMLKETRLQKGQLALAKGMQDKFYAPIGPLETERQRIGHDIKHMGRGLK